MYMTVKRRKNKNDLILIFFILKVSYAQYTPLMDPLVVFLITWLHFVRYAYVKPRYLINICFWLSLSQIRWDHGNNLSQP